MAASDGRRCCERYDALMVRLPAYEAAVEALERLWPVIDKWMPRKALVAMPRQDLDAFSAARAALARLRDEVPA